jgi:hypothetical protein
MVFAVAPFAIGAAGVLVAASVFGYSVVNLNSATLLSESAMDANGEPKALGNENQAQRDMARAKAEDAAITSKQHYI